MMNRFSNFTQALTSRISGSLLLLLLLSSGAAMQAQQIEFPATGEEVPGAMHVVQKGETLYGIAKQYDTTPTEIKRLNGIDKATIYPGQMLVVSTKTATTRSAVSRSAASPVSRTAAGSTTPTSSLDAFARQNAAAYNGPSSLVAAELKILAETPAEPRTLPSQALLTDATMRTRGGESLAPVAPVSALPETVAKTSAEWYRVQEGDDIYSIADTYEVRPEDITAWNDGIRSVRPGDVLMVRKGYEMVNRASLEQPANRYDTKSRSLSNLQMAAGQATGNTEWGSSRGQDLPTTASQTYRNYLSTAPAEYIGSREMKTGAAAKSETGKFVRFEYPSMEKMRFYAIHKSLPQGTKVKMGLPDNPGYIEVVIVGKLDYQTDAIIGLSPACLQVLEGAGNPKNVTIAYD